MIEIHCDVCGRFIRESDEDHPEPECCEREYCERAWREVGPTRISQHIDRLERAVGVDAIAAAMDDRIDRSEEDE